MKTFELYEKEVTEEDLIEESISLIENEEEEIDEVSFDQEPKQLSLVRETINRWFGVFW